MLVYSSGFYWYCGDPGQPPQNVPQWHIDYFQGKLLKKWPMPKGHCSSHSVALNAGNKALMWKVHFLPGEVEGHPEGIWGWEGQINKLCYFNSLPQAQTLFRFFTVWAPKTQISLSCQFLINLFLCLKTIKAPCLFSFLNYFIGLL